MQVFRNPFLWVCAFFYVSNTVFLHFRLVTHPFLKFYLNDLVCMPLVFGAAILLQRYVVVRQLNYRLTKWQIIVCTVYFAIVFEGIIPLLLPRYTSDFWDVAAYITGSWLFYIFGNAGNSGLVQKN